MEPVKFTKEESSLVSSIQYDEATWVLDVLFHNGNGYSYSDVGPEVYAEMLKADSKGSYYNRNIKGHYESLNHRDLPPEMEPKTIEGDFKEQLKASVDEHSGFGQPGWKDMPKVEFTKEGFVDPPQMRDPSWPPEDVMDVIMGNDALEVAGGATAEPEVMAPVTALVVVGPVQEMMAKLSDVSSKLAVLNKKSEVYTKRSFVVTDQATYDEVQQAVRGIKAHGGEIVQLIDPVRDVFYRAYSAIQEKQKAAVEPLNIAMKAANGVLNMWDDQKTREAQERQRKADRLANEQAEKDRQAESQRLTLAAVDDHLIAGDTAAAERLFAEPIEAPSQPVYAEKVYSEAPAPKGVSKRKNWKGEVVDIVELILDVAEGIKSLRANGNLGGHAPVTFLEADAVAINQAVKGLEENARFPGIRAYNEAVRSTRAGK